MATLYMDASTAQILYQGKLLTTAGCAVLILGSRLSKTKWTYLVMLTVGAMVVQMNASSKSKEVGVHHDSSTGFTGLVIVTLGCFCSSSAGVYFEKMLKALAPWAPQHPCGAVPRLSPSLAPFLGASSRCVVLAGEHHVDLDAKRPAWNFQHHDR